MSWPSDGFLGIRTPVLILKWQVLQLFSHVPTPREEVPSRKESSYQKEVWTSKERQIASYARLMVLFAESKEQTTALSFGYSGGSQRRQLRDTLL